METQANPHSKTSFFSLVKSALILAAAIGATAGCTFKKAELGSSGNPVKLFFTPSVDAKVIEDNSKAFKEYLEKTTPYKFQVGVPQSYVAVVESFGTKRADVAAMNTFAYILANQKYGAEARLTVLRHGSATYQSQFLAKAGSKIKSIEDFKGKKIAFVDPVSASGYLLPLKMLKAKGIEFKESVFAGKHDNVVTMIYQGQVDGGATFYSPSHEGQIQDARRLVLTQYPDVEKKISIIGMSDPIPNDPIVFRKDMPEEMKTKITEAFLTFIETPEGKIAFAKIYSVDGIKRATDADYDSFREVLKAVGKNADEFLKK